MWNYKEGFTPEQNRENALKIKAGLEGLKGVVPGIVDIKVHINELEYSNKDVMLDSTFEDEAGFLAYKKHPAHVEAGALTKDFLDHRVCLDYIEHGSMWQRSVR